MEFIRRHTNFLFVFVLPVYLYIVHSSIQNKHTHVYANGIVVTHSHPVDTSGDIPINQHDHTKTEICLFCSLHLDFYDVPELTELHVNLCEQHHSYFQYYNHNYTAPVFLKPVPRGPPA